jgi:hypothetical protein
MSWSCYLSVASRAEDEIFAFIELDDHGSSAGLRGVSRWMRVLV